MNDSPVPQLTRAGCSTHSRLLRMSGHITILLGTGPFEPKPTANFCFLRNGAPGVSS